MPMKYNKLSFLIPFHVNDPLHLFVSNEHAPLLPIQVHLNANQ